MSSGQWMLRDLDSRNGTMVGSEMVRGDWLLKPGHIVRIGHTQLVFVHKLSDAFTSSGDGSSVIRRLSPEAPPADRRRRRANVLAASEPTTITHRRGKTKLLAPGEAGGERRLEDRPRGGEALPPGLRVGQGARRGRDGRVGAGGPGRGNAERRRRAAALVGQRAGRAARRRPGGHRLAKFLGASLPPGLELPGHHRDARRRGGAGPQRDRRQHVGHPRQPRRNPGHQRDLRAGAPRQPGVRPDPSLFDRSDGRARSRRPRVHPGGGRHRGGGHREHSPPPGIGRESDPRANRKRRAARAAGHPQRDHRPQRGDSAGDRGDRPRGRQQRHGVDPRRERRGKGIGRPRPSTTTARGATTSSCA